ncbi:hypothetical protein PCANC_05916 [Puccinia coronata f. sp. avenae]|uniref:Uncharacterized protein n=1 Tax=Puccinia coronata f. sp. avenae TaxID=200324 RepID=A0A2N5VY38_9BASI|nr:hypothetical protein PCANC_05916 [Puccinia coronata f. sp. avenae]
MTLETPEDCQGVSTLGNHFGPPSTCTFPTKPCKPPYTTGTTPDLPHPYPALIRCCRLAATEALPLPSRYCRRPIRQSSRHLHCPRNNLSPPPYTT